MNVEVSSSRSVDPRGDGSCHARGGELLVLLVGVVVMVVVMIVVGRGSGRKPALTHHLYSDHAAVCVCAALGVYVGPVLCGGRVRGVNRRDEEEEEKLG